MIKRQKWTKQEDDTLIQIMKSGKFKGKWDVIASELRKHGFNKTPKQTKTRWMNNLAPDVNKGKWNPKDMECLFEAYQHYGNRWRKIAENFEGRTDNCVKNQFFSLIRKALRTAVKLRGNKQELSCTRIINKIKPKILADFLNEEVSVCADEKLTKKTNIKTIEFVKDYVYKKPKDSINNIGAYDKLVIQACIDLLLNMNSKYLSEKNQRKIMNKPSKTVQNNEIIYDEFNIDKTESTNNVQNQHEDYNLDLEKTLFNTNQEHSGEKLYTIKKSLNKISELINATGQFDSYSYGSAENLKYSLMTLFDKLGVLAKDVKEKLACLNCEEHHLYDIANCLNFNQPKSKKLKNNGNKKEQFKTPNEFNDHVYIEKHSDRVFSIKNIDSVGLKDFDAVLSSCKSGTDSAKNFGSVLLPKSIYQDSLITCQKQNENNNTVKDFKLPQSIINPSELSVSKTKKIKISNNLNANPSIADSNIEELNNYQGCYFDFSKRPTEATNFKKSNTDNTKDKSASIFKNMFI